MGRPKGSKNKKKGRGRPKGSKNKKLKIEERCWKNPITVFYYFVTGIIYWVIMIICIGLIFGTYLSLKSFYYYALKNSDLDKINKEIKKYIGDRVTIQEEEIETCQECGYPK